MILILLESYHLYKGLSSRISGEREYNDHSMYVDSKILVDIYIWLSMAVVCHKIGTNIPVIACLLHAGMLKAQKASPIVGKSENTRTLNSIRVNGNDEQLAD